MPGKQKHFIDESELRTLYQTKTMRELAEHYKCGESTIWARLKAFGITHETYGKLGHRHRPREFTLEHRQNMSAARKGRFMGVDSPTWKGGKTVEMLRERAGMPYRVWRTSAIALRGNKCQQCGTQDGSVCECCGTRVKLHVHHIHSFAKYPEQRFDPQNSEVLCPRCHYSRHKGKIG